MYVISADLPEGGLTQDMHNQTVLLPLGDILCLLGILDTDNISTAITRNLIADAIKRLHPDAVKHVFKDKDEVDHRIGNSYPEFPTLERLPARKTEYWQFAGITADEGTIEGTYAIHDDIYKEQLGLHAAEAPGEQDDFSRRLYLVHGDQLTAQNIRTVQREQCRAALNYDRRQWMLGIPAWFHIQMNLMFTIVRTHFAAGHGESNIYTLASDATSWNRTLGTRDNIKYYVMEPIIV